MAEHRHSAAVEDAIHLAQHHLPVMPAQKEDLAARVSPADVIGLVREVAEARTAALASQAGRRTPRAHVLDAIDAARTRQDERHGVNDHPDGTGPTTSPLYSGIPFCEDDDDRSAAWLAMEFRNRVRARFRPDATIPDRPGTWTDILLEEVFEALAEDTRGALRARLVEVAAVAVAWAERIDVDEDR